MRQRDRERERDCKHEREKGKEGEWSRGKGLGRVLRVLKEGILDKLVSRISVSKPQNSTVIGESRFTTF